MGPKAPAVKPEPRTVPFSLEIPHADAKKPDPLQMPETFLPVMEKTSLRKAEAPKKLAGSKEMYDWSGGQGADKGSRLPPGTQSVVEAGVIAKGPVQYVPVPIVTMPDMSRPPRAPQPFGEQNGAMANAYGSPSKALGPNMTTNDESMVNAFTSLPSREMVAQASNAFTDGASTAGPQPVMPAAAQPMYPRSPYGMMAQAAPAMPSTAMTPQGVMPVGYQAPMSSDPRMVQSAAEQQMLAALHGSLFPSQREWAAEGLATLDWRIHPEIVQALVTAAREDPAPTVRVACLHDLTKMQVSTMLVVEAVQKCMGDQDPRVRQEAEQALAILHPATPHDSRSSLQPVGSWRPN